MSYREIRVKLPTFIYFLDLRRHIKGEVLTCHDSLALQKEATYKAGRGGGVGTAATRETPVGAGGKGSSCAGASTCQLPGIPWGLPGMGPEQLLPHFPASAAGLAESISSVTHLSPGSVL